MFPPPPPPAFTCGMGGDEAEDEVASLSSMLLSWYLCGYHTGYYMVRSLPLNTLLLNTVQRELWYGNVPAYMPANSLNLVELVLTLGELVLKRNVKKIKFKVGRSDFCAPLVLSAGLQTFVISNFLVPLPTNSTQ